MGVVAPLFFFPLVAQYEDASRVFRLLNEDCGLLENLLKVLAAASHRGGVPAGAHYGEGLVELGYALRLHRQSAVRRAVLVSLCSVGESLLPAVLVEDYATVLPELHEWLSLTAADDPDDGCRQLARVCLSIMGKAIERS